MAFYGNTNKAFSTSAFHELNYPDDESDFLTQGDILYLVLPYPLLLFSDKHDKEIAELTPIK